MKIRKKRHLIVLMCYCANVTSNLSIFYKRFPNICCYGIFFVILQFRIFLIYDNKANNIWH